jgi:MFS family permease
MAQTNSSKLITKDFIIAFIMQALNVTCFSIFNAVIPIWMTDKFGSNPAEVGLVIGLAGLSPIIGRPFMGHLLDRFGRKTILQIAVLFGGVMSLILTTAKDPTAILIIRFIQLIPFVATSTALATIASDVVPEERRGEGLSYFTTSTTLPFAFGPTIGLSLYHYNWLYPFYAAAGIGALSLIATLFFKLPKFEPQTKKFSFKATFDKRILITAAISAISFMALPTIFSFIALYGKEISLDANRIGLVYTSYATSLLITRLVGAKTIDKKDPKFSGIISFFSLILGLVTISLARSIFWMVVGGFLVGAGLGIIFPTLLMMAINMVPEKRGVCNAMVYAGIDVASSVGASIFGVVANFVGKYSPSYMVIAGFELVGLLVFLAATMPLYNKAIRKTVPSGHS